MVYSYYITVLFMKNLGFSIHKALFVTSLAGSEYLVAAIAAIFVRPFSTFFTN